MSHYVNYLIVLIVGTFETYLSTNWTLFAVDKRPILSSLTAFLCMIINLTIVA